MSDLILKRGELWVQVYRSRNDGLWYAIPDDKVFPEFRTFKTEQEATDWANEKLNSPDPSRRPIDKEVQLNCGFCHRIDVPDQHFNDSESCTRRGSSISSPS